MVAYSFKARFEAAIRAGEKTQTIRADRKRHARPDEIVQLYVAMRTRHCRKLGEGVCLSASPVRLDFDVRRVEFATGTACTTIEETDAFARADGFADWAELEAFWAAEHPGVRQFSGILIRWVPV